MAELVAESEARGRLAGTRDALIVMLEHRFGQLDRDLLHAIGQADEETLLDWMRIAISVKSLAELRFEALRPESETSAAPRYMERGTGCHSGPIPVPLLAAAQPGIKTNC